MPYYLSVEINEWVDLIDEGLALVAQLHEQVLDGDGLFNGVEVHEGVGVLLELRVALGDFRLRSPALHGHGDVLDEVLLLAPGEHGTPLERR